jgi:hypothetical protein
VRYTFSEREILNLKEYNGWRREDFFFSSGKKGEKCYGLQCRDFRYGAGGT